MMRGNRLKIQQAILKYVKTGYFYGVSYDPESRLPIRSANRIWPTGYYCNEISSEFAPAKLNRRTVHNERTSWTFELKLSFSEEADISAFEDALAAAPIKLPDIQTILNLTGCIITHPPVKDPNNGTLATLTIDASVIPI
jgi:hypothetical protein|tara:strand:+ start:22586 stop:23005 length:420 start_codon:yes stop_codon:yes gene_type:complete